MRAAHVSADPLVLACGWHWQESIFHLASDQLLGAAPKLLWVVIHAAPYPSTCTGISSSWLLLLTSASTSWDRHLWRSSGPECMPNGKMLRRQRLQGEMSVLSVLFFSSAGGICQNPEWAPAFVNHLAAFNCANNRSSDANKQYLFTCIASLALRGPAQSLHFFMDI